MTNTTQTAPRKLSKPTACRACLAWGRGCPECTRLHPEAAAAHTAAVRRTLDGLPSEEAMARFAARIAGVVR